MVKFKISEISDGLFIILISFLSAVVFCYYFLKNGFLTLLTAIAVSLLFFTLYLIIRQKKKGKLLIKREDEEKFIKCLNALCLSDSAQAERYVFETLLRLDKNPVKVDGGIICNEHFFFTHFSYDKITISEIVNAYKLTPKGKNLCFIGISFLPESEDFANSFISRIKLIPLNELFPLMKQVDCIPDGGFIPSKKKVRLLTLFKASFSHKKVRSFTLYGISLLIMSNFVFYPIWYIVSGCSFLFYAILIKFFAQKPIQKDIF